MGHAPVDDVRGADAALIASRQACELGAHAAVERSQRVAHLLGAGLGDQARGVRGVREPAGDVGEEDHLVAPSARATAPAASSALTL